MQRKVPSAEPEVRDAEGKIPRSESGVSDLADDMSSEMGETLIMEVKRLFAATIAAGNAAIAKKWKLDNLYKVIHFLRPHS